jgi:hypothetical protein
MPRLVLAREEPIKIGVIAPLIFAHLSAIFALGYDPCPDLPRSHRRALEDAASQAAELLPPLGCEVPFERVKLITYYDDEAAGLNPAKFKVATFMVSAAAAGLGGAASVHLPVLPGGQPGGPNGLLSLDLSLLIIVACVVGGLGTLVGPLKGLTSPSSASST